MHLISPLIAGVRGAEGGTAELHRRGATGTRVTWYSDFEGTTGDSSGADINLDSYGRATVYVDEMTNVIVKDSSGATVAEFVAGAMAPSVEYIGAAFTGVSYVDSVSAVSKPIDLDAVLTRWSTNNGAPDWKVKVDTTTATIAAWLGILNGTLFYNVQDPAYGATGDGSTDDTAALQAAIDAAEAAGGGIVFFPKGTYRTTAALSLTGKVSLWGAGQNASAIVIDSASNLGVIANASPSSYCQEIRGLRIGALQTTTGNVVALTGTSFFRISDCHFGDAYCTGTLLAVADSTVSMKVSDCTFAPATESAILCFGVVTVAEVDRCTFIAPASYTPTYGMVTAESTTALCVTACKFINSAATAGTYSCFKGITGTSGSRVVGCDFGAGGGATVTAIDIGSYASTARFSESANTFATGITPYEYTVPTSTTRPKVQLGSRASLSYYASGDSATVLVDLRQYGSVHYVKTGTTAITNLGYDSSSHIPPDGHETKWFLYASAGATNVTGHASLVGFTDATPAMSATTYVAALSATVITDIGTAGTPAHFVIAQESNKAF